VRVTGYVVGPLIARGLGGRGCGQALEARPQQVDDLLGRGVREVGQAQQVALGDHAVHDRAEQVLRAGLEQDAETFAGLIAPDGYVEWPYRPAGVPDRVQGRERIREFLTTQAAGLVRFDEYRNTVIRETVDPAVVIVEYDARGTVIPTGAPLHQTVIAVLRIRDGLVVSYRDYLNPLVLAETLASVGGA
jgi:uncharacterized protein